MYPVDSIIHLLNNQGLEGINCRLQGTVSPKLKQPKPLLMLSLGINNYPLDNVNSCVAMWRLGA